MTSKIGAKPLMAIYMNTKNYISEAPVMKVRMDHIHPSRTYAISLNAELRELQERVRQITTKKMIASFLVRYNADKMHQLIDEVDREIRNIQDRS